MRWTLPSIWAVIRGNGFGERVHRNVVEAEKAFHDAGQRIRNGRLFRVGEARRTVDLVLVDAGVQRKRDLSRRAAEGDPVAAARGLLHLKALGRKPRRDLRMVARAQSETGAVLVRRQPFVELRRRGILLVGQQPFQLRPLSGRLFHHQGDMRQRRGRSDLPAIVLRLREAMHAPAENMDAAVVDRPGNPIRRRGEGMCGCENTKSEDGATHKLFVRKHR